MRTVTVQSIYNAVLRRIGLDPIGDAINHDTARAFSEHLTDRCQTAWTLWDWPELTRTEERAYRPVWRVDIQYKRINDNGHPDEIYYLPNTTYYRVNTALNVDPPVGTTPTDVATNQYFIAFTPITQFIERDQPGQRSMGPVLNVYSTNPSTVGCCGTSCLKFRPSEKGITICDGPATTVFVQYYIDPPKFSFLPFIDGKSYISGDVALYTSDGNCYRCIADTSSHPPTDTAFWAVQPLPDRFTAYLKAGVTADCLREMRGDGDEQARQLRQVAIAEAEAEATGILEFEIDDLLRQGERHYYLKPRYGNTSWRYDGTLWWMSTGLCCSEPWTGNEVFMLSDPVPMGISTGGGPPPLVKNVYSLTGTTGGKTNAIAQPALDNANLLGVSWMVRWSDLETTEGNFDATEQARMITELGRIAAAGKKIFVRFSGVAGSATQGFLNNSIPNWVYTALGLTPAALTIVPGVSYTFNDPNPGGGGQLVRCIPVPFNATFLTKQKNFITRLGALTATMSEDVQNAITHVNVPILNCYGDDWRMPQGTNIDNIGGPTGTGYDRSEVNRWLDTVAAGGAGYTTALMLAAAKGIVDTTITAFPAAKLYLPIGSNGSILDRAAAQAAGYQVPQVYLAYAIQQYGITTYPGKVSLAMNSVAAAAMPDPPGIQTYGFLYQAGQVSTETISGRMLYYVHGDTRYIVNNGTPLNTKINAQYPNAVLTETEILEQSRDHAAGYNMNILEVMETDVIHLPDAIAH